MKRILSGVNGRYACPSGPNVPQVQLTEGGEFEVSDELAAQLVELGRATLVTEEEVVEAQPELPLNTEPVKPRWRKN